jgi:osmotically-inducible protein OsmY
LHPYAVCAFSGVHIPRNVSAGWDRIIYMITAITPSSDLHLQSAVRDELRWTPDLDAAGIKVAVKDATVTLSGEIGDYSQFLAAKRATLRVHGVTTLIDRLTVRPKTPRQLSDTDIAREVERALTWATNVPATVKAQVTGPHVALTGEVDWNFQREAAQRAIAYLRDVQTVTNQLTLTPRTPSADAALGIRNALIRNAQLDAHYIAVTVAGTKATLTGHVRSWAEKKHACAATWSSPHVTEIDDHLDVLPA